MACAKTAGTAVLFVHGIGEPSPLQTLLTFVEGLLAVELDRGRARIRRMPVPFDPVGQRYMLTTTIDQGAPIDFFEQYWAPHTTGQRLSVLVCWLMSLAMRPAGQLPLSWKVGLALLRLWLQASCTCAAMVGGALILQTSGSAPNLAALTVLLLSAAALWLLTPVLGDAACYLLARPATVPAAQRIEADFQKILIRLQETAQYQKVVVVGHSLGSVIAYQGLCAMYQRARYPADVPWCSKVKALVTIGSPLAHAPVVLSSKQLPWRRRLQLGFIMLASNRPGTLFNKIAWHNLYDPVRSPWSGDPVGGAMAPQFGAGVSDHPMKMPFWGFTHSKYWCAHPKGNPHQQLLRRLIGLS